MKKIDIGIKESNVLFIKREEGNTSVITIDPLDIHFVEWDLSGIELFDINKNEIGRIHLHGFGISEICESTNLLNLCLYKMRHREFSFHDDNIIIIRRKTFTVSFLYKIKKFLHLKFCV